MSLTSSVNSYTIEDILRDYHSAPEGTMVYVGTDSSTSKTLTSFITVVVFHFGAKSEEGGKGCKVFPFVQSEPKIGSLRQKLLKETYISMDIVLQLMYGNDEFAGIDPSNIEVHSDYNDNPRHKSNAVVKEARAYVTGQGLVHKIKPDALAATGTADYIGRNTNKEDYLPHEMPAVRYLN
jgi:predicted RNase H-related nuclease YkuK (DUF458 family)